MKHQFYVFADETPKHPGNDGSGGVGYNGRGNDTIPPTGRDIGDNIWVGIERDGATFRMFGSNDGKVWTRYAGTTQADFAADMLTRCAWSALMQTRTFSG